MKDEMRALILYRFERSTETLDDARILFGSNKPLSAVNRIYYAMFYAVNALLLTKKLSSSKHSGVLSLFQQYFVKPGIVSNDMGQLYASMFDRRQKSDYRDFVEFDKTDIETWIQAADNFIQMLGIEIKKSIN